MSSLPPVPHSERPQEPLDEFDWPPQADDISVYEIGSVDEPWRRLQETSVHAFAHRHGAVAPARERVLGVVLRAGLVTAAALLVSVTAWRLYRGTNAILPVEAGSAVLPTITVVPPAAEASRPVSRTIIVTYPVDAPATAAPATGQTESNAAAQPGVPADVAPAVSRDADALTVDRVASDGTPAVALLGETSVEAATEAPAAAPLAEAALYTPDAGIRTLLQKYEEAYDHRDVRSAAALWPSLDARALARAFASLDRQDLRFDRCDIDAGTDRGSAICEGSVRYVPNIGRGVEKETRITWTFDLTRTGSDWRITKLNAR